MPIGVKIYLAVDPVDLRASFYRLSAVVRGVLGLDPQAGQLFVFLGRRRDLVKILFWDRSGYCIFAKKLEQGLFKLPGNVPDGVAQMEIDFASLTMLLEGIDLQGAKRRPAFQPPAFGINHRRP